MNDLITNGTEIKQRIIAEITKATQCVYVAVAWFTDRDIASAIINAKSRNVIVDIILSSNANNEEVTRMLKGADISVHSFDTGDTRGLMHHKFCLFDNKVSINGSFNFSYNASRNNVENIVVSNDTSLYAQFLTEFEQLKYNIDNQMALNSTPQIPESKIEPVKAINMVDTFSQQLHNLIYSSAKINSEDYWKKGYETSKRSSGSIEIFKAEYNNIEEEIKAFTTDDSLSNTKSILSANISRAFENTKTNIESEKQEKITFAKKDNDLEKRQTTDKISIIQQEKSNLESGNQNTGEKGLLQINKEIDKNKLERKTLEQSFLIKKFWSFGTILSVIGLVVFSYFLSIFFASAIYKVFFEENVIRTLSLAGGTPKIPQLIDANAIIKIFSTQGALFGIFSALFFLIPILLTNLKLFGNENKYMFLFFLIIFDVVVSCMVAFNQDYIRCLIEGKNSTLQIWEVLKRGEFWLIFLFGSAPLFLTHYLIENIAYAYRNSKREIIDAEKNKKIQFLDKEIIDLNYEKESIVNRIKEKDDAITESKSKITQMETGINNVQTQIESSYNELQKQIKSIFDDFNTKVISGKIFTDVVLESVITAYKSGFIEFLPEYYATDEVSNRVREIEQFTKK
ncbi:MAG: phospholipase D-like domain-containing protein [Bacteroidota bacterium]